MEFTKEKLEEYYSSSSRLKGTLNQVLASIEFKRNYQKLSKVFVDDEELMKRILEKSLEKGLEVAVNQCMDLQEATRTVLKQTAIQVIEDYYQEKLEDQKKQEIFSQHFKKYIETYDGE